MNKISKLVSEQWVMRWNSDYRVLQAEGSSPGRDVYHFFFPAMIFISILLGLMDFNDTVILCSRPNNCCQENLKVFWYAFIILRFVFMKE